MSRFEDVASFSITIDGPISGSASGVSVTTSLGHGSGFTLTPVEPETLSSGSVAGMRSLDDINRIVLVVGLNKTSAAATVDVEFARDFGSPVWEAPAALAGVTLNSNASNSTTVIVVDGPWPVGFMTTDGANVSDNLFVRCRFNNGTTAADATLRVLIAGILMTDGGTATQTRPHRGSEFSARNFSGA